MRISHKWFVPIGYTLCFLLGFEIGGYQAALYNIAKDYNMGQAQMGYVVMVLSVASIVCPVVFGPLADRIEKKRVVSIFSACFIAGCLVVALAHGVAMFFVGIFLVGTGLSLMMGTTIAALSESNPSKSNRYSNLSMMICGIGAVLGPMLINVLINAGYEWRIHFLIVSVLCIVAGTLWTLVKVDQGQKVLNGAAAQMPRRGFIISGAFNLLLLAMLLYFMIDTGVQSFIKAYFVTDLAQSQIGALSVSMVWVGTIPSRVFASFVHRHKKRLVICCLLTDALALAAMASFKIPEVAVVFSLVLGISSGPLFPTLMSITMDLFPARAGMTANLMISATGVGGALAGLLGYVIEGPGFASMFYLLMGVALASAVFFLLGYYMRTKQFKDKNFN